jgi:hypothetical protein
MSTAICFNLSLLAHVSNIPTGHWVPKTIASYRGRPGPACGNG